MHYSGTLSLLCLVSTMWQATINFAVCTFYVRNKIKIFLQASLCIKENRIKNRCRHSLVCTMDIYIEQT